MALNKISYEVTDEKDAAVQQFLDNLTAELDFLVDLDIEERRRLGKMGRKNLDFVKRSYRHAEGTPRYLPSYVSLEEFRKDVSFSEWLRKLEKTLNMISDKVKDTALLAEAEAFKSARLYYNSATAAAKADDDGAEPIARDLAVHYKRLGYNKTVKPAPEEPTQTPAEQIPA
jgi:hypothetical protein